jgi:hypothetical protein
MEETKRTTKNYADPKRLLEDMIQYKIQYNKWVKAVKKEPKLPKPRISEFTGQCILDIADRLSRKPNFAGYTFREDMVGYAIENVLTYIDNFNPRPSKSFKFWMSKVNHSTGKKYTKTEAKAKIKARKPMNPFSYFTQIIYWAFLRKIAYEKKQTIIKYRAIQNSPYFQELTQQMGDESTYNNAFVKFMRQNMGDQITEFEDKKRAKKDKAKKKNNLEKLL